MDERNFRLQKLTVALVNKYSGERTSVSFVLEQLRRHLGENNVFDLFPTKQPDIGGAKEFLKDRQPSVVIVAGGDGTISLVLDIMDALRASGDVESNSGYVAILPMGTGNDLSITLGFGGGYTKPIMCAERKFAKIMKRIQEAKEKKIDKWKLVVTHPPCSTVTPSCDSHGENNVAEDAVLLKTTMINYFSIGFDAQVVRNFDRFRQNHPILCSKRFLNKAFYGIFGLRSMCTASPLTEKNVKLIVDDKVIPLRSDVKALLVTNVTTYAAGAVIWKDGRARFLPPEIDDRILEVSVLHGALHLAGIRMGIRKALKIAQGSKVDIVAPSTFKMQYDGEIVRNDAGKDGYVKISIVHSSVTHVMMNNKHAKRSVSSPRASPLRLVNDNGFTRNVLS